MHWSWVTCWGTKSSLGIKLYGELANSAAQVDLEYSTYFRVAKLSGKGRAGTEYFNGSSIDGHGGCIAAGQQCDCLKGLFINTDTDDGADHHFISGSSAHVVQLIEMGL